MAKQYISNSCWKKGRDMDFKVNKDSFEVSNLDKFTENSSK